MSVPDRPNIQLRPWASLNTLEFYWSQPLSGAPISSYMLLCSSIPYSTIIGSSTNYAKVSTLTNTQDYTFQLAGINQYGMGPFHQFRIVQPGTLPSGVTNLTASKSESSTVSISWNFSTNLNESGNHNFIVTAIPSSLISSSQQQVGLYATQDFVILRGLDAQPYTINVQSVNDAGWSQSPVSTTVNLGANPDPTNLAKGNVLWLDANDPNATGILPSTGSIFSTWKDKSGGNNHAQTLPGGSFVWNNNTFNGLAAFNFDGQQTTQWNGNFNVQTSTMSAIAVFSLNQASRASGRIIGFSEGPTQDDYTGPSRWGLLRQSALSFGPYRAGNYTGITLPGYNVPTIIEGSFDGNYAYSDWLNGANTVYNSTICGPPTFGNFNINYYCVGNNPRIGDFNGPIAGYMAEMLIYDSALTAVERDKIRGYLAWKWGLQAQLPPDSAYINGPP